MKIIANLNLYFPERIRMTVAGMLNAPDRPLKGEVIEFPHDESESSCPKTRLVASGSFNVRRSFRHCIGQAKLAPAVWLEYYRGSGPEPMIVDSMLHWEWIHYGISQLFIEPEFYFHDCEWRNFPATPGLLPKEILQVLVK